jgi:PKHD-type hydroxylase
MLLESYYRWYQNALPLTFCDDVLNLIEEKQILNRKASVAKYQGKNFNDLSEKEKKDVLRLRNSEIIWLEEPWIFQQIGSWMQKANEECNWNFIIDGCETAQFTTYNKKGYYNWHMDMFSKPYTNDRTRKLSITLSLSDDNEYSGGNLEFALPGDVNKPQYFSLKEIRSKGSIVVFPGFVWHRVAPVTKGTRKSLVIWFGGPTFK